MNKPNTNNWQRGSDNVGKQSRIILCGTVDDNYKYFTLLEVSMNISQHLNMRDFRESVTTSPFLARSANRVDTSHFITQPQERNPQHNNREFNNSIGIKHTDYEGEQ